MKSAFWFAYSIWIHKINMNCKCCLKLCQRPWFYSRAEVRMQISHICSLVYTNMYRNRTLTEIHTFLFFQVMFSCNSRFHRHRRKLICHGLKAVLVFLILSMIATHTVLIKEVTNNVEFYNQSRNTKGKFFCVHENNHCRFLSFISNKTNIVVFATKQLNLCQDHHLTNLFLVRNLSLNFNAFILTLCQMGLFRKEFIKCWTFLDFQRFSIMDFLQECIKADATLLWVIQTTLIASCLK